VDVEIIYRSKSTVDKLWAIDVRAAGPVDFVGRK
jgi:hypothetical protein